MNKEGLIEVIKETSFAVGLPISAEGVFTRESQSIKFRVQGLNELETFYFSVHRTPLAWILELKFDDFSQHLIDWLAATDNSTWKKFKDELNQIPRNILAVDSNVDYFVNAAKNPLSQEARFTLAIWTEPQTDWNQVPINREIEILSEALSFAFILVDSLFKGSSETLADDFVPDLEGMQKLMTCVSYTRSRRNRKKCLDAFGYICSACGLDPKALYGPEGKFIIHVHHLTPVSNMGEPRTLDPELDLVPLCPNCHNFVHKFSPPKLVSEIQQIIAKEPRVDP
jgi:5-methylcytosine-specific restriction protein A